MRPCPAFAGDMIRLVAPGEHPMVRLAPGPTPTRCGIIAIPVAQDGRWQPLWAIVMNASLPGTVDSTS